MIEVVLLGYGNVGGHLLKAFVQSPKVMVKQVYNRNPIKKASLFQDIPFTDKLSDITEAELYILAVPDDAIASFSKSLPFSGRLVAHTSGAVAMEALYPKNRRGVFYPLQTFSKKREINFSEIPICIEAAHQPDLQLLKDLGGNISDHITEIPSEKRAKLHLAAVFVNNFVNYLYQVGSEILNEEDLPFELLKPLIAETARKMQWLNPHEAQTGPAKRNDLKTIEKHLHLLGESPHKKIYELFTEAIKNAQPYEEP